MNFNTFSVVACASLLSFASAENGETLPSVQSMALSEEDMQCNGDDSCIAEMERRGSGLAMDAVLSCRDSSFGARKIPCCVAFFVSDRGKERRSKREVQAIKSFSRTGARHLLPPTWTTVYKIQFVGIWRSTTPSVPRALSLGPAHHFQIQMCN